MPETSSADPGIDLAVHRWRIDPREQARHEQRRGRRHGFERLDPARTALVVVDMVPFFVAEMTFARGSSARSTGWRVARARPVVTGVVTNVCCNSSARDAATVGYRVVVVADANAARTDAEHNASLRTVYRSFGDVRPTSEIVELLRAAPPAESAPYDEA